MPNPLLDTKPKPVFTDIIPKDHIESALTTILTEYRETLANCLQQTTFTWQNLCAPLNAIDAKLENMWGIVGQLNDNVQTDEIREIHDHCEAMIEDFDLEKMQNPAYYAAVKAIAESPAFAALTAAEQRDVELKLEEFEAAGVNLAAEQQQELIAIEKALSEAQNQFNANVMDAMDNWFYPIADRNELKGLPESIIQGAAAEAKKQEKEGWILSLQTPVVLASMKLLDNRHLRKILYHAYNTLASEVNPGTEQWNNLPLIETILRLRHRKAQLLGHNNYAEFALANKMAKDPQTVFDFLTNLANKSAGPAKRELAEIRAIAAKDGITDLEPWDSAYYAEKLRLQKYNLSEEATKPYFPLEKVLSGFFTVLNKLYGITLREEKPDDVWHEDVRYFGVYDEDNQPLGCVYADFYARPKKRDGAWMTEGRSRVRFPNGELQLPIAYLSTDFGKPGNETPALLEFRDAETLFHEFGHCIHQILTTMEVKSVSGINGVPEDGIEFPSQLMEFFVHDPAVIPLISSHYQTGEPLPVDMLERIQAAKHFQAAMMTIKQVYLALFDFRLHWEYDPEKGARTIDILTEIQKQYMPMQPAPEDNRFPCQFTHIFSDDYAVGYYGYKWSEVLSSDAFSRFEAAGTLSADVGRELRHYLLGQGGTPDFMEAYVKFRGRQPRIESLLHYTGLDKLPGLSEAGKIQAPVLFNDRKRKATADPVVSDEEKEENSMDVPKMG